MTKPRKQRRLKPVTVTQEGVVLDIPQSVAQLLQGTAPQDKLDQLNFQPGACEQTAALLNVAFAWEHTSEGKAFWMDVYKRLLELAQHSLNSRAVQS